MTSADFYIVAREPGAENPSIPTWANSSRNPAELQDEAGLSVDLREVERIDLTAVPGAFQLIDVLNADECGRISEIADGLGYLQDAAVSLPRSIRHNDSMTWVVDDRSSELIWQRCQSSINQQNHLFFDKQAVGLNNRFRFYRYQSGDYFSPHTDGAWPGSKVINRQLVANAFDDRWSQLTFLLFLTDEYEGGATRFLVDNTEHQEGQNDRSFGKLNEVDIRTPKGGALCFPHGSHPMHCLHSSTPIIHGIKEIIRSDVLFEL